MRARRETDHEIVAAQMGLLREIADFLGAWEARYLEALEARVRLHGVGSLRVPELDKVDAIYWRRIADPRPLRQWV